MSVVIGYYVHHHGQGHRQRALAIARAYGEGITLLGTGLAGVTGGVACLDLPDDRLAGTGFDGRDQGARPPALHYAPLDHEGVRQRTARIATWIARARPRVIVVDVSVEVAMLARLASVPTIYVRLSGHRLDPPHRGAFAGAIALLAPYHEALDDPDLPDAIRAQTYYAPGIIETAPADPVDPDTILVVIGRGGAIGDGERWASAARAVPDRRWIVIGPCTAPRAAPDNLSLQGWVEGADTMIARAGVVIGGAGDGLVSFVLAHRRPFLCFPEPRPYGEQILKARRLAALGASVMLDDVPQGGDWHAVIAQAQAQAAAWPDALQTQGGAARVAHWLKGLAASGSLPERLAS